VENERRSMALALAFAGEEKEGYVKSKETRVLSTFSYLVDPSRATTRRIGA